jgi:hypothetical protein
MITVYIGFKETGLSPYNFQDWFRKYRSLFSDIEDKPVEFPEEMTFDEKMICRVIHFYVGKIKLVRTSSPAISGLLDMLSPEAIAFIVRSLVEINNLTIYTNNPTVVTWFLVRANNVTVFDKGKEYSKEVIESVYHGCIDLSIGEIDINP